MRYLAFGVAAATAALIAGCAPSPTPSAPTAISPAPSTASVAPEHGSLAHCLHEHGVPDSAGTAVLGPPPGVDPGIWNEAMKDCSTLAPGPAS
ncbi:hypothetical protein BayCH28_19320 [Mycolicibacterium sp. CH28]|uniref:hypothetical protein n=1 Tax=Mycolicibacterium sp. CH28 TaxID=2512237 RepID=UPI001080ECB6|nr:hypothetical protein [Mycolicibacterium sp. CH28]TGD85851.1 hypothetical protein BayCH28_19320 [Mycolicibacterium sp. CH28]